MRGERREREIEEVNMHIYRIIILNKNIHTRKCKKEYYVHMVLVNTIY